MANNFYGAVALTGGAAGALDGIDGALLNDLDAAFVVILGKAYFYTLDDDSAAAEVSPNVIAPDDNAGTKRWVLTGIGVPQVNDASNPSIAFGGGNTGFYERLDDHLSIAIAGNYRGRMTNTVFVSATGSGFSILFAAGSDTVPTYSFNGDENTGVGRAGVDTLSLITGGVEGLRVTKETGTNASVKVSSLNLVSYDNQTVFYEGEAVFN